MKRLSFLFALFATAAMSAFAGKGMNNTGISFQMLEGTWETYDASGIGRQVTITFSDDGAMKLTRTTTDRYKGDASPFVCYEGPYDIVQDDMVAFRLATEDTREALQHYGMLKITPVGNMIDVRFNTALEGVGEEGSCLRMFNTAECHHVPLDAKPNVLQLFEAAMPFLFNITLKDAETLLLHGRQPVAGQQARCVKDLRNGFVSYTGGGAPASGMEACIWRCTDGTTLLGVNCLGEGIDVQLTQQLFFFRYDPKTRTLTRLDRMSETVWPEEVKRQYTVAVKLPRQGKDINLVVFSYGGDMKETRTVAWKGNGF